ncbi:sensor histidine kinase [Planctobacterium marinum]|uniref:histidine kinase n=1 Tax=Planctobacterium marinum TaxID=1631968 RepID=A0AA48KQZ9_9ALTE|nr:hypothetical protein MACH26_38320 [Planctobacterium marinum]
MKLKTKFTLLVACCTLLLLGINYGISVYSANKALMEFNRHSAVIISTSVLERDEVTEFIADFPATTTATTIAEALFSSYPEQLFLLVAQQQIIKDSLDDTSAKVKLREASEGYQFEISQPASSPILVQMPRPQYRFERQQQLFELFWFPKSILSRQAQQEALRTDLNSSFIFSLIILSAIAILLSWLGANYFLRPLKDVKHGFNVIKNGQLDTRLTTKRKDEVGELITGFNELTAWLEALHQQYEQMNSDLSHELRTPLNAIKSRLEALEDGLLQCDQSQIKLLLNDLTIMERIVEDLSLLSLTESRALQLHITETNVSELLKRVITRYDAQCETQNINLISNIEPEVYCLLDEKRLQQVLVNLLDNALKYGAEGGKITVGLRQHGENTQLFVTDNGEGLSQEQANRIFERFYRAQTSRTSINSLGLGLAICKHLVNLMGGDIKVYTAPGEGCEFLITFKPSL